MFSFKAKQQSLVAVVPGPMGIAMAAVRDKGDKPRLERCDFIPWDDAQPNDKLLAQTAKRLNLGKRPCTTLLDIGEYTVLNVDAPDVPPEELRAAIRWQIKDLIDFHIDDAVVDIFDAPGNAAQGRQKSLYVVVSRTSIVREHVAQLQDAELNLEVIDVPELVLRNITARLPEDEGGVGFIYLARERGLLVVTRQSTLYFARTLELGADFLRQAGEDSGGLSLQGNAGFDRLVLEVQRSLDYYDRYFGQPPVAGLVIAPTEEPLPGLEDYLHDALGLAVRTLDLNEIVASDTPLDMRQQARCLPAIGAALRQEAASL